MDKIEKSDFKYILRKTKLENYLPFALESKKIIKSSNEEISDFNLFIPDISIFLTDESSKFIKTTNKFFNWMAISSEIMTSLIGEIKDVKVGTLSANQTTIKMVKKSKGLIRKPKKLYEIMLPAIEISKPEGKNKVNLTSILDSMLFERYIKGNPMIKLDKIIEEIPLAGEVSRFFKSTKDKIKDIGEVKNVDLGLAVNIMKDFQSGILGFTECSVTSVVRWANLAGANIDEDNISHNMREIFSKVKFFS